MAESPTISTGHVNLEFSLDGVPQDPASPGACSAFRSRALMSGRASPGALEHGRNASDVPQERGRSTSAQSIGKGYMSLDVDNGGVSCSAVPPHISKVSEDHVACPPSDDPAAKVASRAVRTLVFIMLCQVVQAFMSYDGGATPASIDTIQENMNNTWSAGEFGLLGSMDKIGMTATSMMWGRLLQVGNTKALLALGLFMNATWTAIFGSLHAKIPMYVAKFAMGATQSLQGVWATVWTVAMAPPSSKTTWLGFGGVSAGIGNGLGTAVAGFATANGAPYALAFQIQAGVLGLLWIFLLCCPQRWLQMNIPEDIEQGPTPATQGSLRDLALRSTQVVEAAPDVSKPGFRAQCSSSWKNKVYAWSALAISSAMFVMSGIQFLWVRVFVEVWDLDKNAVTLIFLLVTGIGGGIGIAVGPRRIDRLGGFGSAAGVVRSLQELRSFSVIAVFGGVVGIACLYGKLRGKDSGYLRAWGDHWLWLLFIAVFFIWGALNASIPGLCGINMEVVPAFMRTFASGTELTIRNILGYAFGPLLPGVIMDLAASSFKWSPETNEADKDWQLCIGLGFVLLGNFSMWWVLNRAVGAAMVALKDCQEDALGKLQKALQSEDIILLEAAVQVAKELDMHTSRDGEAVIGMANEAIGAFHQAGKAVAKGSQAFTASREELKTSMTQLEDKVETFEMENAELRRQLDKALQSTDDKVEKLEKETEKLRRQLAKALQSMSTQLVGGPEEVLALMIPEVPQVLPHPILNTRLLL
mmetsp:Transcript_82323/g.266549  ORF Transcript_82323/g.266549 Transcript_82323/m.266549 type:complete len:756 (+) Transcript_82323:102-2369(+)